jgi:CRP-like cAMP-binding protein
MQNLVLQQKVEEFLARFEYKKYKKGDTVMHPDETNAKAYYIKSGYVRNYNLTDEGIEFTLHIYAPRSYFPMASVISDVENRYYYEVCFGICLVRVHNSIALFIFFIFKTGEKFFYLLLKYQILHK